MLRYLTGFFRSELGAVSVDFAILTAAAAGLGVVALSFIGPGGIVVADKVATTVANHALTTP